MRNREMNAFHIGPPVNHVVRVEEGGYEMFLAEMGVGREQTMPGRNQRDEALPTRSVQCGSKLIVRPFFWRSG
jgi:hypothetical protein